MRKKFAYLVQGSALRIRNFEFLQNSNSDLFVLTDDKPIDISGVRTYFYPEVSWAEGRNILLESAYAENFLYYIFLDDDVQITQGSFQDFEDLLIKNLPYVGLPLCDQVQNSGDWCPRLKIQNPNSLDQVMQAYSKKAVDDGIVVPFVTLFDHLSWWYSCEINQYLILRYFKTTTAQFNDIKVLNTNHSYRMGEVPSNSKYKGGLSEDGLFAVRLWIIKKFGAQEELENTLFRKTGTPPRTSMRSYFFLHPQ